MRPIQGTPFSGGSPFASSPGMSAMGKGFGSSSMAGGMGGFNMPPFAAMGMMGKSSPFSGGASPFGGGSKALSDGIKKLVDSNKDLIAAIKDLTKSIRNLEKGIGGGHAGGMGGAAGRVGLGGAGGQGSLGARQLQALQASQLDEYRNRAAQRAGAGQLAGTGPGGVHYGTGAGAGYVNTSMASGMNPNFDQQVIAANTAGRFGNFVRGMFGMAPSQGALIPNVPGTGGIIQSSTQGLAHPSGYGGFMGRITGALGRIPGFGGITTAGALGTARAGQAAAAQAPVSMANATAAGTGAAFRSAAGTAFLNMGSGTNAAEILSQIPYVGGLLAAPVQALENRKNQAMAVEMPSMVYTGVSRGTMQGGDPITANGLLIAGGATYLGMNAVETLGAATSMVQAGGLRRQIGIGELSSAIGSGLGFETYGAADAGGLRGSGVRGLAGFSGDSLRRQMYAAGLTGQGAAKYLNSMLSVGEQFAGVGINLGGGTINEIGGLMNSGMRSFEGDAAAGAYTRMRLKGGVAVGQQLGGTFSGLGQNVLMADALQRTGGDFFRARRLLERMEPSAMKARLRGTLGREVGDMAMMGMGYTTDEIEAIRTGAPAEAALPTGANAGAIITKADAESNFRKLSDTYTNQVANIEKLIQVNENIEKKLIEDLDMAEMEKLLNLIVTGTDALREIATAIVKGLNTGVQIVQDFINWVKSIWPFSDIRLKEEIKHIGYSPSGLKIYSWKYKHNPCGRFSGVMAQEILNIIPEAIAKNERGYYMVDYRLLDVDMQNISMEVA